MTYKYLLLFILLFQLATGCSFCQPLNSPPTITTPFTFVYKAFASNTIPQQELNKIINNGTTYYNSLVKQGRITQQDAEANIKSLQNIQTTNNEVDTITMSYNGTNLYYQYKCTSCKVIKICTISYNTNTNVSQELDNIGSSRSFYIYNGINTGHMRNLPLPAINLPYLTFVSYIPNQISNNQIHKIEADVAIGPNTSKLILLPGEIQYRIINNSPEIMQAKSFFNNICTAEWNFINFYNFKSQWIASKFNLKTHTTDGAPSDSIKYHLIIADTSPLSSINFDLSKQLKSGDLININKLSFIYNPKDGNIYQQEKYQRKFQYQNLIKSRRLKLIELFIVISFILLTTWRLIYVIRKRTKKATTI